MISTLLVLALLGENPSVRRYAPPSNDPGMSVRCISGCSGGSGGGGEVTQGAGEDGGRGWKVSGTVSINNYPSTQATSDSHTSAGSPLACRLSDGASFYTASGGAGGASTQGVGYDGGVAWNVAGVVGVSNFPATQAVSIASMPSTPVTGTFWQGTQPVSGPLTDTQLRAVAVPVSGTFWQGTQPVSGTVSVNTHAVTQSTGFDGGSAWNVAGTISVNNLPATQAVSIASMPSTPVTGTFWQTTQPVSGSVSISNFPATQPVSGSVSVSNFPATQAVTLASAPTTAVTGPLTDTQLRATAVPVSGPLTDTQIRATALPVSGPLTDTQLRATPVPVRLGSTTPWSCAVTAIGATLTQCQAAPGAGSLYVTDVWAMSDTATAGQYTLRSGTGANCGTATTTVFPKVAALTTGKILYPGNATVVPVNIFQTPLQLTALHGLCVICVATNTCTIQLHGYTQ